METPGYVPDEAREPQIDDLEVLEPITEDFVFPESPWERDWREYEEDHMDRPRESGTIFNSDK